MHKLAIEAYKKAQAAHAEIYTLLKQLREFTESCSDAHEHADTAIAMREIAKFMNDSRKDATVLKELAEKIGCAIWIRDGKSEPIRTDYVTASPDVTMITSLPKRGTPEYGEMMKFMGVPEELWCEESDAVRAHWPGFVKLMSDRLAAGKPLPPGVRTDKTYPRYEFKPLRSKKKVDEA